MFRVGGGLGFEYEDLDEGVAFVWQVGEVGFVYVADGEGEELVGLLQVVVFTIHGLNPDLAQMQQNTSWHGSFIQAQPCQLVFRLRRAPIFLKKLSCA